MLYEKKFAPSEGVIRDRAASPKGNRPNWARLLAARNTAIVRSVFFGAAALADGLAIICSAIAAGVLYHIAFYADAGSWDSHFRIGCIVAALFVVPNVMRNEYDMINYFTFAGHFKRSFTLWNIACVSVLILGFLTKTMTDASRGAIILFYVTEAYSVHSGSSICSG